MKLTGTRIGRAKLQPNGKRTTVEPKKTWARAKDHRKAARGAAGWVEAAEAKGRKASSKMRGK